MTEKDKKSHSTNKKNEEDAMLWEDITKDITPLKNKNIANRERKKISSSKRQIDKSDNHRPTKDHVDVPPKQRGNETDYRTSKRLKRGEIKIDGRLDLHGMTQNQAYDALLSFIPNAYNQGKRCVLIITGKGNRDDGDARQASVKTGILKQKTPIWLGDTPLNTYILKIETARQNHGGEGALYVLLRRKR